MYSIYGASAAPRLHDGLKRGKPVASESRLKRRKCVYIGTSVAPCGE
jgi:hypothetical protein